MMMNKNTEQITELLLPEASLEDLKRR